MLEYEASNMNLTQNTFSKLIAAFMLCSVALADTAAQTIQGYPVTKIGQYAFKDNTAITSLIWRMVALSTLTPPPR